MPACGRVASGRAAGVARRARLVALAAAAVLATSAVAAPAAAGPGDAELRQRRERLESERGELESSLERQRAEQERLSTELGAATERAEELTSRHVELRSRVERLSGEVEELEAEAASRQERIGQRVTELYKGSGHSEIAGLLSGESPADLAGRSHYLMALSRKDRAALESVAAANTRLEHRRAELSEARDEVARVAEQAREAQSELESRLAEAGSAAEQTGARIARLEASDRRIGAELDARERAERERQRQARERREAAVSRSQESAQAPSGAGDVVEEAAGAASGAVQGATGMVCPQDSPRSYSDTWGAPRSGGRSHEGTDIFGQMGGDVFAITDGVIEWTRRGGNAGLWLSLRGDDGHRYWYMHLSGFIASAGQRVSSGEVIASNGNTGNARGTTPHIHFEYHPGGGRAVNPYPLVSRVCG